MGDSSDNLESAPKPSDPGLEAKSESGMDETSILSPDTSGSAPQSPTSADPNSWIGKKLGKYQVTEVLGKGGMGVVLKAHDSVINRDVAIKVLADHLAADATALGRFLGEARAAGQLTHPNVAGIYDAGQEGNARYLVMEFVPGGSLSERQEKLGPLSTAEATRAVLDACKGIAAAHAVGMIHRDIKPANFLRASDGSIKVADFGLAKISSTEAHGMTQTGTILGTPFFMSPEQCQGMPLDARSDIYSLGATYFSLLTGENPYQDSTGVPQLMYAHCYGEIPDPRTISDSVPAVCSRIVAKAMAKAPEDRYQTASEMLTDLEMINATLSGHTLTALPSESGSHQPIASSMGPLPSTASAPRRSPRMLVGGSIAALLLLVGGMMLWRANSGDPAGANGSVPTPVLSGEPIKVGVLHSLSGTMAGSEMVVVDATMYAIEEINAEGGVLGRPLKAVVADGRSNSESFASEAERLIVKEKVCTIFGCWTSASRKMVKPVVEEHNHLLVYPLQYEGLETSPNIVYMGAAPNQQILPAIDWAIKTLGKKRFFLVGSDYVFPRAANEIIKDDLEQLGAEVVGERYLPLGSSDVDEIIKEIAAAKPDMILNTINGDSNVAFFRALRKAEIQSAACPTLSFSIGEAEFRNLDPKDIAGDYAAWTYFESIDTPENREFVTKFHEKHPQRSITDPMESAYVGLKLWAMAANDAQSLEPKKIRRAMLEQRYSSPSGEVRIDSDTQHCYKTPRIGQLQEDGRINVIWSNSEPVAPEPFPATRTAAQWLALLHDLYTGWGGSWSAP